MVISYFILPANYIISEVIPLLYSLLKESKDILSKSLNENSENTALLDDNLIQDEAINSTSNLEIQKNKTQAQKEDFDIQDVNIIQIHRDSRFIKQLEKKQKKKGFGYIRKVLQEKNKKQNAEDEEINQMKKNENFQPSQRQELSKSEEDDYEVLAFRVLPINRLSPYILQEVNIDIQSFKQLNLKNILRVISLATDNNQVCLISKFEEQGSLQDLVSKNHFNGSNSSSNFSNQQDNMLKNSTFK